MPPPSLAMTAFAWLAAGLLLPAFVI